MSTETTPAIERGIEALRDADDCGLDDQVVVARTLSAALNGPKDQYDCMDDVTLAIHGAICEDSPHECVEWRGRCVKAAEAARVALLGGAA